MAVYKVVIDSEKCKGCELCIHFCPKNVIAIDDNKTNGKGYHPAAPLNEGCVGCLSCAMMCPDCAITIWSEDE